MDKIYLEKNVYEATQERLKTVFEEFDNIYVSFSGGKDSGLLLNLCIDYMKKNNITKNLEYSIKTLKHNMRKQLSM